MYVFRSCNCREFAPCNACNKCNKREVLLCTPTRLDVSQDNYDSKETESIDDAACTQRTLQIYWI